MIVRETALRCQAHHLQGGGDGAGPGCEHRAQQQDLGMEPDPVRKEWRKRGQDQYDRFWQGRHGMSSFDSMNCERDHLSYGTSRLPAYSKMAKVEFYISNS